MYTGSLGSVSNREDWIFSFTLADASNNELALNGAAFNLFVCNPDTTSISIISGSLADVISLGADTFTVTVNVPKATMAQLCAGNYAVFLRMLLNGVNSQIIAAELSVTDGGPTS